MKNKDIKHRLGLTLLYTLVILVHTLLTVLSVGGILYLLVRSGFLAGPNNTAPSPLKIIILFGIAALPAGVIISLTVGRLMLRPVNVLISRLNSLAAGDYSVRVEPGPLTLRHSVIRELANSFNRTARELQGTEMLRSDFVNNFSHEFKTPIVSIAGFAQVLLSDDISPEQQREYLKIIESESLRLSQMATNVLNLTKVENQTVLTELTEFNLSEQIRSCIVLLSPKWENKEIDFSLEFPEYTYIGNQEMLKQVWINLLDNAIKYSNEPGMIEVKIHQTEDMITVSIANMGPEIPVEKREKIFNKFYQADESHASEGNGVGLAIVRRLTELHHGTVKVDCMDGVTTFTVNLPRC